ncbi:hypothetical protein DPMN_152372 [Dreissena polymorpha]|uniref:Uncharacterized protein n=1 Tax=Dreissena polymorpha TaxID=45954 RepID=A0A9D4J7A9_DREPO|nr:hypothetical protein DPMN_152372 [Dreissena polymorpha]
MTTDHSPEVKTNLTEKFIKQIKTHQTGLRAEKRENRKLPNINSRRKRQYTFVERLQGWSLCGGSKPGPQGRPAETISSKVEYRLIRIPMVHLITFDCTETFDNPEIRSKGLYKQT